MLFIKRDTRPTSALLPLQPGVSSSPGFILPPQQVLTMVRLSGLLVLALTCVCAPSVVSACWESPVCSDLSSKERMLVRGRPPSPSVVGDFLKKKQHKHRWATCLQVDVS